MKEPYEKGLAIHSAPSFALGAVKFPMKRKQGERWAGYPSLDAALINCGVASCWWPLNCHRAQALQRVGSQRRIEE